MSQWELSSLKRKPQSLQRQGHVLFSFLRFASLSPDSFYLTQDVSMVRSQGFSAVSPMSWHIAMKVSSVDKAEPWQSGAHSCSWGRLWTAWGSSELTGFTSLWFITYPLVVVKLKGNGRLTQFTSERMFFFINVTFDLTVCWRSWY